VRPVVDDASGTPTPPVPTPATASGDIAGSLRRGRVADLRRASVVGSLPAVITLVYAATTWPGPNRPAMVALALGLLAVSVSIKANASRLASSSRRQAVNLASVVVHLAGFAALGHLDGGADSPMGPMVYVGLAFQAVSVPYRPLAWFGAVAFTGYWLMVAFGDPLPPSYPGIYTVAFLGLTALCARHARSLASLRRRLGDAARIDPLTGCLNRRGFDERLAQERSKADRSGHPFSLVLIDLDSFKAVNDTHGHQVGDDLLVWTARTLQEGVRSEDVVGRVGGDEFALLLVGAGPTEAEVLVERLGAALDRSSPASLGVASHPAEATSENDLRQLADQRLYAAKARRSGRPEAVLDTAAIARRPPETGRREVSARERRQQSISDLGLIGALNFGVGLVHLVAFRSAAANHRFLLTTLAAGLALAVAMLTLAPVVARSRRAGAIMATVTPFYYGLALALTAADGGVGSLYFIGTITPLPIIFLSTPLARAVPIAGVVVTGAVVQALLIGTPSTWYLVLHLAGILGISYTCAVQGAAAARQRKLLTRLSMVDGLTDCLNRRGFEERFGAERARVERHGGSLSLLLLDLDGFKQVNDTLGHAAGDDLLRWVAATTDEAVRAHDVVGRLGGDEFVVLLSDCPADQVGLIAERTREALAARTGVSLGTATLGPDGDDFDDLYRRADERLYAEKARRRAPIADRAP
jgi:diguanylate cyclase (GGDEF)-like protein